MLEEVVKQEKMLDVFKEYLNWSYIMGLNNAGDFNLAWPKPYTYMIDIPLSLRVPPQGRYDRGIYTCYECDFEPPHYT